MKKMLWATSALVLCLMTACVCADEAMPTEASVKELLDVMNARRLIDSTAAQMDQTMKRVVAETTAGRKLSAAQQEILEDMRHQLTDLFGDLLKWEKMQPMMVSIYQRSFTQAEVDSMVAFYKSDAGRAIVEKLPIAMQNTMETLQSELSKLTPRAREIQDQAIKKMKALDSAAGS